MVSAKADLRRFACALTIAGVAGIPAAFFDICLVLRDGAGGLYGRVRYRDEGLVKG